MADADCVTKLSEARQALHTLTTTGQVVETWTRGGVRVKYNPANVRDLRSYISELESQCGGANGEPLDCSVRRRPLRVYYDN